MNPFYRENFQITYSDSSIYKWPKSILPIGYEISIVDANPSLGLHPTLFTTHPLYNSLDRISLFKSIDMLAGPMRQLQLRINWVTASELDGDTFEIQRGADGITIGSP